MYIITGSTGLIGSSVSEYFLNKQIKVLGIDNDLRAYFFGVNGSNKWKEKNLEKNNDQKKDINEEIRKIFSK